MRVKTKLIENFDPKFIESIDWNHLAEPEDLEEPSVYDYDNKNLLDEDQDKIYKIDKKLDEFMWKIIQNRQDIADAYQKIKQADIDYEQFMGDLDHNTRDILSSEMSFEETVKSLSHSNNNFSRGGNPYKKMDIGNDRSETKLSPKKAERIVQDHIWIVDAQDTGKIEDLKLAQKQMLKDEEELENQKEEIYYNSTQMILIDKYEEKIKELQSLKDNATNNENKTIIDKRIKGYEWKIQDKLSENDAYIFFNKIENSKEPNNYLLEALGEYEKEEAEHEKMADESLIFYIRINTEPQAIVKIYKPGDIDDRWELTVVEGDNTALGEMEFDPEFSKMEIITYLTDIYEDIEEVDDEFLDDVIDDKEEIDADFYGMDESLSNFKQRRRFY